MNSIEIREAANDLGFRKRFRKSLLGFAMIYLGEYLYAASPDFQQEMTDDLQNPMMQFLLLMGFRGCTKSTWGSFILPMWAALEYPEYYPFILPISDSGKQASLNIATIKTELERNELIKQDYGRIQGDYVLDWSLESEGDEWQKQNIVLSTGVRVLARSRGQKIRSLKHLQHRPKLVILDDLEDAEWVRTKENRDKSERYVRNEIMGAMDAQMGRLIVMGNLTHMDCLVARLKSPGTVFKVHEYPLIREGEGSRWDRCTWKAMYPTPESLDEKEKQLGPVAWQREMLLKVVAEEDQIIKPEDIHYYDEFPPMQESKNMQGETVRIPAIASLKGHGIDLAISEKASADYTTIVSGDVYYLNDAPKIFIQPHPVNEHMDFHTFMMTVKRIPVERKGANLFFVEDVGYQKAAIQEMERAMLPTIPMRPTTDKRSRLQVVAPYIKNGTVMFPRVGCEELLGQLFNMGIDSHDDLIDGLVWLIQGLVDQGLDIPKVGWV